MNKNTTIYTKLFITLLIFLGFTFVSNASEKPFAPEDVLKVQTCGNAEISPDGQWIAYTVSVPRCAKEKPGSSYRELYMVSTRTGQTKPFITGKVSVSSLSWSPDGKKLAFRIRRGEKAKTQVWAIPVDGGEAYQLTRSKNGVSSYRWHPTENKIAYLATTPPTKREKELKEKGYGFIFYEENLKHKNIYLLDLSDPKAEPRQLTKDVTVWGFKFSPDGKQIAADISSLNLIDHKYMFRKIHILDIASGKLEKVSNNPGKLGNYNFSPDGKKLVYTRALDRKDHGVSQVFVIDLKTKKETNLTIPDFRGHVDWATWKDNKTVLYHAGEGVWPTLSLVPAAGGKRKVILDARDTGIIFRSVTFSKNLKHAAFVGNSPAVPSQLYYWQPFSKKKRGKSNLKQMTRLNPWMSKRKLGKQEVISYKARDGWEIEGILMYPVDYEKGKKYPLTVLVHGGPEAHHSNGWLTRYSAPGQALAGKGFAVLYSNYRASTGYGVKFAMAGYQDAAGKEFDDIADAIDYLVKKGIVDGERVGLGGGSYGGYAAGWFATYYTKYVRAVCMFVGISNVVSKRGTTDIPYEELYVHSGEKLEKMWQANLECSPVYHAHKSKSAVLILGGTADTRVHPSQSLEFYRRLKMNDHPAVRLVQYPGEGHGNRKQPGRIDLMHRIIAWYEWYVMNKKPLDGPMPPLDISDKYGI